MSTAEIFESALKLPLVDRYRLVEALLESADVPDPAIEQAWAKEADDRFSAYQRGEIQARPVEELLNQLRAST